VPRTKVVLYQEEEIDRAVERKKRFVVNPKRHTYEEA
jgi:hypothetical protein